MDFTIFSFKNGKPGVRRQLYRKLYGFSAKGVKYAGALSRCKGIKLGAGAVIVPATCRKDVEDILTRLQIEHFVLTVQGDEQLLNANNRQNFANSAPAGASFSKIHK